MKTHSIARPELLKAHGGACCRTGFALALSMMLLVGCGSPEPADQTNSSPSADPAAMADAAAGADAAPDASADVAAPTEDVAVSSIGTGDLATRLGQVEALVAASDAKIFDAPPARAAIGNLGDIFAKPVGPVQGGDAGGSAPPKPESSGDAPAYTVAAVANGGTITGNISFVGDVRPPKAFKVEKTPEVCGKEDRMLKEVSVADGKLADVVLVLEGVASGKPYDSHIILGPPPGTRQAADGEGGNAFPGTLIRPQKCIFGAFTGVIAQGTALRFENLDPVKHSPHTYEVKGRVRKSLHNQDLEGNGKLDLTVKFKKGKIIKLECDQHPHMQNWFLRVDNPYYAFSATDGTFTIDQVPPGSYKLTAWHPILGEQQSDVKVDASGSVTADFEFSSGRKRRVALR